MNHVMIDIETLSTRANAVILSLAAVRFDPKTGETGFRLFDRNIDIQGAIDSGFEVDGSTLIWWAQQSDEARDKAFLAKDTVRLEQALVELVDFIDQGKDFVWGNPANFDLTIIENARVKFGFTESLWNRRNVMCLRTLKNIVPDSVYNTKFEGVPHDPLDDCWHQIKQVVKIYNHLGL